MNHQTEENYSFCPKCGSLMENGVCPECSVQKEQGVYSADNFPQIPKEAQGQEAGTLAGHEGKETATAYPVSPGQSGPSAYPQNPYPDQNQAGMYPQNPYQNQAGGYPQNLYGQPGGYPQNPYQNQTGGYPHNPYQNQAGGYPQNPYGQPGGYIPGPGGPFYEKPKKDNKVWITVGIVVGVIVVLMSLLGSFYYGYFIMKLASGRDNVFAGRYEEDDRDGAYGREEAEDSYDDYEAYGDDDGEAYVPSPDDEYYYGPCDAIDENVSYSFKTKSYTNEDPDNNIDVVINYFELQGDSIPNIDRLNEALEKVALYYVDDFPQYSAYAEYGDSYTVYITSYVTYNDEEMISIVMDEYIMVDDRYHLDLYPINIDIRNGVVLDNDSLLEIDTAFAEEFRDRNDRQNGSVEFLDSLTDEELAQFLGDRDSVIAYYTPLGMEIGLNYESAGSSGWVTVTYKDYDRYLSRF